MTELRKRMIECLQLRGLTERTQQAYVRAVRQLAEHSGGGIIVNPPLRNVHHPIPPPKPQVA